MLQRRCADPLVGELFCSSWLSRAPATTTVTATEATTSTLIHVETALTTLVLTTGMTTTKACRCFLSTATPFTVTALTTTIPITIVESTSIVSSTVTNNVVETVSVAAPAVTIPPNVLINGGFETYIVNGINPCTTNGYCAGGRVVVRAYPPTSGSGYIGLRQTFDARPSTSYSVTFLYRCLNFDNNAVVEVWYHGIFRGLASCPAGTSAPFLRATGIRFTTDSTGRGELWIRFTNPSNLPYLYIYADDFQATAA
ncbi:hypothetical protein GE09DRAFT_1176895 [Coniochaeta sp. 2T2.1]|nr:hypothetical protein GE09DRAFT_1176895 [Coniochaeta sp. 2T2.1]